MNMAGSELAEPTGDLSVTLPVIRLTDALNAGNLEAVMSLWTEDCTFENTYPPPDGMRYQGKPAVQAFWEEFFRTSSQAKFEIEEIFALNDRCIMRWTYHWLDGQGTQGHIRGVDVYRVRDGIILEKLSYVKG